MNLSLCGPPCIHEGLTMSWWSPRPASSRGRHERHFGGVAAAWCRERTVAPVHLALPTASLVIGQHRKLRNMARQQRARRASRKSHRRTVCRCRRSWRVQAALDAAAEFPGPGPAPAQGLGVAFLGASWSAARIRGVVPETMLRMRPGHVGVFLGDRPMRIFQEFRQHRVLVRRGPCSASDSRICGGPDRDAVRSRSGARVQEAMETSSAPRR